MHRKLSQEDTLILYNNNFEIRTLTLFFICQGVYKEDKVQLIHYQMTQCNTTTLTEFQTHPFNLTNILPVNRTNLGFFEFLRPFFVYE